jgi:transposase
VIVAFVDAHREAYGIEPICRQLAIAPSTYYRHQQQHADPTARSGRAQRDDELRGAIRRVWDANQQVYGPRKVWKQLRRDGIAVARCTVERLMRALGLVGAVRGRAWTTTTLSHTAATRPPDLVDRSFVAARPNQLWVSDFTYVATWQGFVYVAFVIDVFARRIVGWRVSASLKTDFVLDALEQAIHARCATTLPGLVHHSDRRQIKVARDTAVKARSAAIIALKTLLVNAPCELRESLQPLTDRKLIDRCARLLPGVIDDTTASTKHALRALATRGLSLASEIDTHDKGLDAITMAAAPTLRQAFGIGSDSAAEMMIVAGDNPTRVRSEAAFAKLCGACPIPASSGVTHRHRLFRGGHRQANAALYRIVTVRMRWHQPTMDYVTRRTAQGLSKRDIIRCLKRFVVREIYHGLLTDHRARQAVTAAA